MDLDFEELEATRNKSTDKMFEELGYELLATGEDFLEYFKAPEKTNGFGKTIYFFTDIKKVQMNGCFTSLELKAINKKVEELRMEKRLSLNEKIKRFTNNHLPKTRFLQLKYNGSLYEISYHKACFWWQERFSIKEYIKNLYTNHWEVNEVIDGSKILVMGNGSGIIYGFFPKRKMKKQLYASARYWQQYKR